MALLPVGASIAIAYRLALHDQQQRTAIIASEALHRALSISAQMAHAHRVLEHSSSPPCSPAGIALMRDLALSSSYLQLVGYVAGDRLICSSYGNHGDGISVGPPDFLINQNAWIRRSVLLPFLPDTRFFMATRAVSGYSSLALPDLILDSERGSSEISIALVAISNRNVLLTRGQIDVQQLPIFHKELGDDAVEQWRAGRHRPALFDF